MSYDKETYMKRYREENREHINQQRRDYMKRWREENPEEAKSRKATDHQKHKEKRLLKQKKYRERNPGVMEKWKVENKERVLENRRRYNNANPDKQRVWRQNRRSRLKANGGQISHDEWKTKKEQYGGKCAYCGENGDRLTMDHVTPIISGGPPEIDNIVPACLSCNMSKGTKLVEEWGRIRSLPIYGQSG